MTARSILTFNKNEDDAFRTFLILSIALHFFLISGTLLKHWLMPSKTIIIPEAIRVDMVALPDKIERAKPIPQVKPPPPVKVTQHKPTKPKPNFLAQQQQAFAQLQAMEAIEKMKKELADRKTKPVPPKKQVYKGNIISSGDSFNGLARLEVNQYLSALKKKIHQNWSLPQWLSGSNLKAQVIVTLDSSGAVTRSQIYVSSGNSMFDNSCLAAVQQASPFAPPPAQVANAILLIKFPF